MTGCFENLEGKTLKSRRSRKKKSGKKGSLASKQRSLSHTCHQERERLPR